MQKAIELTIVMTALGLIVLLSALPRLNAPVEVYDFSEEAELIEPNEPELLKGNSSPYEIIDAIRVLQRQVWWLEKENQ